MKKQQKLKEKIQTLLNKVKENTDYRDLSNHTVLNDYVLILTTEIEDDLVDDEVVRAAQYEDKPSWGIVLKAGKEVTDIDEGDIIVFMAYGANIIRTLGTDFSFVRSDDIMSVYKTQ